MRRAAVLPWRLVAVVALGLATVAAGCGDSPTPTTPTPPAPPVQNAPPVIKSLTASPARLEVTASTCAGSTPCPTITTLTAVVEDAETPVASLTYEWAEASQPALGTLSGAAATVTWTAPATLAAPTTVDVRLTVVEKYASRAGGAIDSENRVSAIVGVRVHDSVKETGTLATLFLQEFSNSAITDAQYIVRNFSDSCRGKADELNDITVNRANYVITNYTLGAPASTITFAPRPCGALSSYPEGDACVKMACAWTSDCKPGADPKVCTASKNPYKVSGECVMVALYEKQQWWLCDSRFYAGPSSSGAVWMR